MMEQAGVVSLTLVVEVRGQRWRLARCSVGDKDIVLLVDDERFFQRLDERIAGGPVTISFEMHDANMPETLNWLGVHEISACLAGRVVE